MASIEVCKDIDLVRTRWKSLYVSNDPFGFPFRRNCNGMVFYPTDGYHLSSVQYDAVVKVMRRLGEIAFMLSIVEFEGDFIARGEHWECRLPSYQEYSSLSATLENALYSLVGTFGVLVSHEQHAVVGGSEEAIRCMRMEYPGWSDDLHKLNHEWRGKNNRWLDRINRNATGAK